MDSASRAIGQLGRFDARGGDLASSVLFDVLLLEFVDLLG